MVKKWLLHCSLITKDDYCDEVKWDESPFGKEERNKLYYNIISWLY